MMGEAMLKRHRFVRFLLASYGVLLVREGVRRSPCSPKKLCFFTNLMSGTFLPE